MYLDINLSAQDAVICCICLLCSLEDPYGDIQTPNILDACLGESLSIYFPPSCDGSVSVASLSDIQNLPSGSHLKSIIYHFVFSALTCPPVDLADTENILRTFCASFTVSYSGYLARVTLV